MDQWFKRRQERRVAANARHVLHPHAEPICAGLGAVFKVRWRLTGLRLDNRAAQTAHRTGSDDLFDKARLAAQANQDRWHKRRDIRTLQNPFRQLTNILCQRIACLTRICHVSKVTLRPNRCDNGTAVKNLAD